MSEARKVIIFVMIFVIAVGGFYFYKINSIGARLDETKEAIQKEEEYLDLIANQQKEMNNEPTKQEAASFYDNFPNEKGIPQLLQFFHDTADNNHINISSLSFEIEEHKQDNKKSSNDKNNEQQEFIYQAINLNLRVSANSYEQLTSFMEDVYRSKRMMNLVEFNMLSNEDHKITVHFIFQTFYTPEMKELIPELDNIEEYEPSLKTNPFKEGNSNE